MPRLIRHPSGLISFIIELFMAVTFILLYADHSHNGKPWLTSIYKYYNDNCLHSSRVELTIIINSLAMNSNGNMIC